MKRLSLTFLLLLTAFAVAAASAAPMLPRTSKDLTPGEKSGSGKTNERAPSVLATVPEIEDDNDVCPGQPISCGDTVDPATIEAMDSDLFSFTASAGDVVIFETFENLAAGPSTDTVAGIFNADCTVLLAANDDKTFGDLYSRVEVCIPEDGTYNAIVEGFDFDTTTGGYLATLTCLPGSSNTNDTCDTAVSILCGPISDSGSTNCLANDYDPVTAGCTGFSAAGADVVYSVTASAGWILTVDYTSTGDASMYIVTDCADVDNTCVAGADANLAGETESLLYVFPADGTYYLILDNFGDGGQGGYTLTGALDCGVVSVEDATWGNIKSTYRE